MHWPAGCMFGLDLRLLHGPGWLYRGLPDLYLNTLGTALGLQPIESSPVPTYLHRAM